ncbi:MAG TPA: protein kinase, partial [Longimicrobiales bacterium]|nr:protein kinase [Longimicrobiales bacterium]
QGRYRLQRELGRGGMATVYLAEDVRHGRTVAVKVLDRSLSAEIGERRFEQEVRTTARLNHPHILPLFDSGEAAGRLFYVMPVAQGESLDARLAREGRLVPGEAVAIAVDVARALAHAHELGVVHRDIKPANILLHQGESVVADFGVALATGAESRLTADGQAVGTFLYMSPEQVGGEEDPDGRADQYALGCVLFEMLTGEPPFPRSTARAAATAHLVDPPPPLPPTGKGHEGLAGALARALAKDPRERFPSMAAFAEAVAEALGEPESGASEGVGSETSRPPGLVVLPFENLSPDPDNEYFSDGLTEEVIADLSRVRALRVISRTSAMRLKATDKDLPTLARELDVRYVLEGGVRKAGDKLRITARLIEAVTDRTLWSERVDGTLDDVFEIQEQVARAIADALRVRLSPAEDEALGERPIADPRAYESYLRARYEAWRFSPEGLERATRYIEAGLEIVGENELLLGTLGHITAMHVESGVAAGPDVMDRLESLAGRIFALRPDSARGHWIRMFAAFQRGAMGDAIVHGRRAMTADPDDPDLRTFLGYVYANVGRTREADRILAPAVEADPLTPVTQLLPGFVAVVEGRYDDALGPYRRAWELDPESPFTGVFYGWALAYARRPAAAIPFLDRVADEIGGGPFASWARSLARALEGDAEGVARAITPEFEAAGRGAQTFARAVSDSWALVGDADRALEWLGRAVDLGLLNEPFLREHAWFLDPIREDPRFEALMDRVRARVSELPAE